MLEGGKLINSFSDFLQGLAPLSRMPNLDKIPHIWEKRLVDWVLVAKSVVFLAETGIWRR